MYIKKNDRNLINVGITIAGMNTENYVLKQWDDTNRKKNTENLVIWNEIILFFNKNAKKNPQLYFLFNYCNRYIN